MRTILLTLVCLSLLPLQNASASTNTAIVPFYGIEATSSDAAPCYLGHAEGWMRSAMLMQNDVAADGSSVLTFTAVDAQVGSACAPFTTIALELPYVAWGYRRDVTRVLADGCVTERTVFDLHDLPVNSPAGFAGFWLEQTTTNACTGSWSRLYVGGDAIANV